MSGSKTIIGDADRLDNVHPGDILRHDFLIGEDIDIDDVVAGAGIEKPLLTALLDGRKPIDANLDLRLARYLGISDGVFLALQNDYDIEEVKRANGAELDRITRRAA